MLFSDDEILGGFVFGLVKLVGYAFAAGWVARYYRPHKLAHPVVVALSRMALGALVGWLVMSGVDIDKNLPWYLALIVARSIEWGVVFWYFYERAAGSFDWGRLLGFTAFGTVVSCLLDLPAMFGGFVAILVVYGIC